MNQSKSGIPKGCMIVCGVLIGVFGLFVVTVYYIALHTSMPVTSLMDKVAEDFTIDGKEVKVEFKNVEGSLSSGITIGEMIVHDKNDKGDNSTLHNLKFRYSGIWDLFVNRKFIIEEISAENINLVFLDDFFKETDEPSGFDKDFVSDMKKDSSVQILEMEDTISFELRKVEFKNTRIRTKSASTDFTIPLVYLSGLKILDNKFSLKDIIIKSDLINLALVNHEALSKEGSQEPTYKIEGDISPAIHTLVKKRITFSFEIPKNIESDTTKIGIFDNSLKQSFSSNGGLNFKLDNLNLSEFIDFKSQVVPERLNLEVEHTENEIIIIKGDFHLGLTKFSVTKKKFEKTDLNSMPFTGLAEINNSNVEVIFDKTENEGWPFYKVNLKSDKNNNKELLSQIYFQSTYAKLNSGNKSIVDNYMLNLAKSN